MVGWMTDKSILEFSQKSKKLLYIKRAHGGGSIWTDRQFVTDQSRSFAY